MIETLLRELAEAGAPSVTAPPYLAEKVLAARRRRRRQLSAAGLAGLVAVSVVAARSTGDSRFYSVYEPSGSMSPTVATGEHLVADRTLTPARGDLVELTGSNGGQAFITVRRVIGLPGDVIACPADASGTCHGWTRNGEVLDEPWIGRDKATPSNESPTAPGFFIGATDDIAPFPATTVTPGHVFVLGDNRDNAVDSRNADPTLLDLDGVLGVGVEVVGTDGRHRAIPGAPVHQVPGPGGAVDPPEGPPTSDSAPVS